MGRMGSLLAVFATAFFLVALNAAFHAPPAWAKAKPGEAIVTFDDESHAEQGPVQFSHPAHKKAFGKEKLDCKQCHIKPKLFPMKRKAGQVRQVVTMEEMMAGKACGACHNGEKKVNDKDVFSVADEQNCARCHKKSE